MTTESARDPLPVFELLFCSALALLSSRLEAIDWPQYRGPNHDGASTEAIRTDWAQEPPRMLWKVPLQPALSSFTISAGKAFTQVRRAADGTEQEFCIALNADTGLELWAAALGRAFHPDGGVGADDGP